MRIDVSSGEIRLTENQPVSLRDARGLRIECTAGVVWITPVSYTHLDVYKRQASLSSGNSRSAESPRPLLLRSMISLASV